MKVFVSYDHKNNSGILVERILSMLLERGHELWMDTHENYSGVDWRRNIADGISDSQATLAFLSEYTKGERSACLDELAIAVSKPGMNVLPIMLEEPGSFHVPPTIVMQQWLDMSDWRVAFRQGESEFSGYLENKVAAIVDVLESEDQLRFQGEIASLDKALLPDIREERYRSYLSKKLYGREWLSQHLNGYVDNGQQRFLYITAGPGFGKSHFIASAMHNNPNVLAGYFFNYAKTSSTTLRNCLVSLAFQIASRLHSFRKGLIENLTRLGIYNLEDPSKNLQALDAMSDVDLFETLILIPFHSVVDGEMENMVIVLDGIDEASIGDDNAVIDLLNKPEIGYLPPWVKVVFTCRMEENLRLTLQSMDADRIDLDCEQSDQDILLFLRESLSKEISAGMVTETDLKILTEKCEKTFIYADMFLKTYQEDASILSRIDKIPLKLNGLYNDYFKRLFKDNHGRYDPDVKNALEVLVANRGLISQLMFEKILNCSVYEFEAFIERMRSFIVETITEDSKKQITFYHKAFNEWLVDREKSGKWVINVDAGRKQIVSYAKEILNGHPLDEEYYFHLPFEEKDFIYKKLTEFAKLDKNQYKAAEQSLMKQICFLFFYQRDTYNYSQHGQSNDVADAISKSAELQEYRRYYPWSCDIRAEVEIAKKNWLEALKILEQAEEKYKKVLEQEIDIYALLERNIAFCYKNVNPEYGTQKLLSLLALINDKEYTRKDYDLAHTYYHLCVLYYNKSEFETSIHYGLQALDLAPKCHDDIREMSIITDNELGWSYFRLNDYENSEKYFRKSLSDRVSMFGNSSRYTALGYDALARFLLYRSNNNGSNMEPEAVDYAVQALNIHESIFGRTSSSTARSIQTMALIKEKLGQLDEAEQYALEAYEIYKAGGEFEENARKSTEAILNRIRGAKEER